MIEEKLPRGVWFEPKRGRYRVRLWRNKRAHLSYHETKEEAVRVHTALFRVTRLTPKVVRRRPAEPAVTLGAMMRAARELN